jgi:hypothetical protein
LPSETDRVRQEELCRAYHLTFNSPLAQSVLGDLSIFCMANEPTFNPDPYLHARNSGRREVWERIVQLSKLLPEQTVSLQVREIQRREQVIASLREELRQKTGGDDYG